MNTELIWLFGIEIGQHRMYNMKTTELIWLFGIEIDYTLENTGYFNLRKIHVSYIDENPKFTRAAKVI